MLLDRVVYNDDNLKFWNSISYTLLARIHSDHNPFFPCLEMGPKTFPSPFHFMKIWIDDLDCTYWFFESWKHTLVAYPMYMLSHKLKILKLALCHWNNHMFSEMFISRFPKLNKRWPTSNWTLIRRGLMINSMKMSCRLNLSFNKHVNIKKLFGRRMLVLLGIVRVIVPLHIFIRWL